MFVFIYNFYMKYIDTHAHIVSSFTKEPIELLIKSAKEKNIEYILVPGTNLNDSFEALKISQEYNNVFAGFGIHPSDSDDKITKKLDKIDFSGFQFIGETGIDLFHSNNPPLEVQKRSFIKHLEIARLLKLPIEIHTRDAYQEVYDIIKNYQDLKLVLHSFTGNLEWANKFLELGAYISFSGIVTFKNATDLQNVMLKIPLNRILIETDSPFLAPTPHRGKTNKPEFVKNIGDFIALKRNDKNVIETIYETTKKIFNLK